MGDERVENTLFQEANCEGETWHRDQTKEVSSKTLLAFFLFKQGDTRIYMNTDDMVQKQGCV